MLNPPSSVAEFKKNLQRRVSHSTVEDLLPVTTNARLQFFLHRVTQPVVRFRGQLDESISS